MPNLYSIEDTTLTGLANAIRSQTGDSSQLSPSDMIDEVTDLTTYNITIDNLQCNDDNVYLTSEKSFGQWTIIAGVHTSFGDNVTGDSCTFELYNNNTLVKSGDTQFEFEVDGNEQSSNYFNPGEIRIPVPFDLLVFPGTVQDVDTTTNMRLVLHIVKGSRTFNVVNSSTLTVHTSAYALHMYEELFGNGIVLDPDAVPQVQDIDSYTAAYVPAAAKHGLPVEE